MKPFLAIIFSLLTMTTHAAIGPDLSKGTDVAFFTKLREVTAKKDGYNPLWKIEDEREKIVAAVKAGEVDTVLQLADPWLKKVPIDADIHLVVAMCFKEKGDLRSMCQHLSIFYGLLNSITSAGDGLTEKTAYKVVSVQEEYSLIQEIGGKVKSNKLDGTLDVLEVERHGKTVTMYFDVTQHLAGLKRVMEGK